MSRPATRLTAVSIALFAAFEGAAVAQGGAANQASLVGGPSICPTPALVWQHLVLLVPPQVLADRLGTTADPLPPVQVFDQGTSFRVIAGNRVREHADPGRDCAQRAQFAAVFVAVAAGADVTPPNPLPAAPPTAVAAVPDAPAVVRARLDVGAALGAALGGGETAVGTGLSVRIGFGAHRLVPVAALSVLAPLDARADGVAIRQWQTTVDADLRTIAHAGGRSIAYVEVGAALEVLADRPTNLALSRTQFSYALGPRAAAGLVLATRGRLAPFLLIHAIWFPFAPQLFALPAGDLGRAVWSLGLTAGASWGLR